MTRQFLAYMTGAALGLGTLALSFSSGPPDGRTGAPGESNCTACHTSFPLNSGTGSLTISGPTTYNPGDTIDLTIDLEQFGQQRWGFELTALDGDNQPAGELIVAEPTRTQKSTAVDLREYIKHRSAGTDAGTSDQAPGWTVKWAADNDMTGPVTFYAAGNAANNDGTNKNDFIYTTSLQIEQAAVACCAGPTVGNVDGVTDPYGVDISDLTRLIEFLFITYEPLACTDEGDVMEPRDGLVDVSDLTRMIEFLFITYEELPPCPQ